MNFLKWIGKKLLKTILYLTVPSAIFFLVRFFFQEETDKVTGEIQKSTCEVAVLSQMRAQLSSEDEAKKASGEYCECLSNSINMGDLNILKEFSLSDISKLKDNPEMLKEKMQQLVQKEGVLEAGKDCMSYIVRDYNLNSQPHQKQKTQDPKDPSLKDIMDIRDMANKRQKKVNEALEALEEEP